MDALGQQLSILVRSVFGCLGASSLEGDAVSLVLHTLRSDESLDLGGLGVGFGTFLLGDDFTTDDEFAVRRIELASVHKAYSGRKVIPDIILLGQTKEPSNLGGTFGTEALRVDDISETRDISLALLDDGQSQDGEILSDNAATHGFALALASSSRSVARVAVGEEQFDSGRKHLE